MAKEETPARPSGRKCFRAAAARVNLDGRGQRGAELHEFFTFTGMQVLPFAALAADYRRMSNQTIMPDCPRMINGTATQKIKTLTAS